MDWPRLASPAKSVTCGFFGSCRMLSRLFVGLFALLLASAGQANAPRTFSEAKKIGWKLYARQSVEFYCGCRYSGNRVDLASCGYKPRKNANRARRIEWEHIVGTGDRSPAALLAERRAEQLREHDSTTSAPRPTCTTWCRASRSTATAATSASAGCRRDPSNTAPARWWWTSRRARRCHARRFAG